MMTSNICIKSAAAQRIAEATIYLLMLFGRGSIADQATPAWTGRSTVQWGYSPVSKAGLQKTGIFQ